MKRWMMPVMAAAMTAAMSITAFAAGWQRDGNSWWYATNADNSQWYAGCWAWIDGNGDGTAECYLFDANGYLYMNGRTPDGYLVDANGAWTVDGRVQTRQVQKNTQDSILGTYHYKYTVYSDGTRKNRGYSDRIQVTEIGGVGQKIYCIYKGKESGSEWCSQRNYEMPFSKNMSGSYTCDGYFPYMLFVSFESDGLHVFEDGSDSYMVFAR